jgi:hypothetical protein
MCHMAGSDCTPCKAAAAKRAAARAEQVRTMADGSQLATSAPRGRAMSPAAVSRGKAYEIRDETGVSVGRVASTMAASKLAAQHPGATVHIV